MLWAAAGRPFGLSSTQTDSMYGWSSVRGVTNEIFTAVPAVTLLQSWLRIDGGAYPHA
jgi:hypothetical protein